MIALNAILDVEIAEHHGLLFVFASHAAYISEPVVEMTHPLWCSLNFSAACEAAPFQNKLKITLFPQPANKPLGLKGLQAIIVNPAPVVTFRKGREGSPLKTAIFRNRTCRKSALQRRSLEFFFC